MSESATLPLALTLGEPAGIGPDLTIQLWRRRTELRLPPFYLIGDPEFIKRRARLLGCDIVLSVVTPAQANETFARALPIVPLGAPGEEDGAIVAPAVQRLQEEGIDAVGPLPADTLFHERARAAYDVALCMYHDQALIPIKTLAFDHAVNVTLGLPFVRTSPDHGTAFDIAGTDRADPSSLLAALRLAAKLAARKDVAVAT